MNDILLQAFVFFIVALNFIVCVLAVARPWLEDVFPRLTRAHRKRPQYEAVIIPFARPSRRGGGRNV